jgi:hypothetical protein
MIRFKSLAVCASGRRKPKPTMNGVEKSDPSIVPTKPANKAWKLATEPVEGSFSARQLIKQNFIIH